jgi:hypothetical protein
LQENSTLFAPRNINLITIQEKPKNNQKRNGTEANKLIIPTQRKDYSVTILQ